MHTTKTAHFFHIMDRRNFFRTLSTSAESSSPLQKARTHSGISPYNGDWGWEQAAHLLRRTLFGPKKSEIEWAILAGKDQVVTQLLAPYSLPAPPLNFVDENDPQVPIGSTWINAFVPNGTRNSRRLSSLIGWNMGLMIHQEISLREKMVLFWHNHFAVERREVADARFIYRYNNLLRTHAFGNFQSLVEEITIDPAMLRYLNGNQNLTGSPNENYARELFELFTIGKGPLIGPGNYTTFTEDDVRAAARVLTGWRDRGYYSKTRLVDVQFRGNQHDISPKEFSAAFNNQIITDNGADEYKDLIQMIFNQADTARFICREIYRWFVYYEIDAATEQNVIEPLAQLLINNNYEIAPVLETLFKSEHFFDQANIGCLIKNPIDFTVSTLRQFEVEFPDELNLVAQYRHWLFTFTQAREQQMELFNPPSVAGWPAYYQVPSFHEMWISSVTLPARSSTTRRYNLENGYRTTGFSTLIKPLEFVENFSNPANPDVLIKEMTELLLPQPLYPEQLDYLKEVLIPGLPNYEWTDEYNEFLSNFNDINLRASLTNKLRLLIDAIMSLAEYHLS